MKNEWDAHCTSSGGSLAQVSRCADGIAVRNEQQNFFGEPSGTAQCGNTDRVIGGGCLCDASRVESTAPNATGDGWSCTCSGTLDNVAFAICVTPSQVVCASIDVTSNVAAGNIATKSCAGNEVVLGGGCSALGGSTPAVKGSSASGNQWRCTSEGAATTRAWVVCASKREGS